MRSRLAAVVVATVITTSLTSAQAPSEPGQVVALQRIVFGTGYPAFPDTPEKMDAQLRLAAAYAAGSGIGQDIQLACGLAEVATRLSLNLGEESPVHLRATSLRDEICANSPDRIGALSLLGCPSFGVEPQTMAFGPAALLVIDRDGWTVEDATGTHRGEWVVGCGSIVASIKLRVVEPPRGSRLPPRRFLETFVWRQSSRDDGIVGTRSLEWYVDELRLTRDDFVRGASEAIVVDERASIWPPPPVPEAVGGGARFGMLRSGAVRWWFDRAPELGTAVIPPLVP